MPKTLNVILPDSVYYDLERLAYRQGRSITEIVRTALGLVALGYEIKDEGDTLARATKEGIALKEIVLP